MDECLVRLTEDKVWARGSVNETAIGNLVLHLCGNVMQWVISGVGGQENQRERDGEFEAQGGTPLPALRDTLRTTVQAARAVIEPQTAEQLPRPRPKALCGFSSLALLALCLF